MLCDLIKLVRRENKPRAVQGKHFLLKRFCLLNDLLCFCLCVWPERVQMLAIFGQSDRNQRHGQRMRRKGSQIVHCPFQFRSVVDAGTEHHLTVEAHVMGGKAAEMLHDAIREIPDFPAKVESELKHCILAHHGELEYGSPKKPALLEALALNFADNTDAKMETMLEVLKSGGENPGWLGYNRFLETNVRKTTPTE